MRLRYGRVWSDDLKMPQAFLLHQSPIDFSSPHGATRPSSPRHGGRTQWNDASLRKACSGGQRLLICHAEDTIKTRPLPLSERYALAARGAGDGGQKRKNLPEVIELVIGMKVMVTSNIATDLGITHGARPPLGESSIITPEHLLQCVLVKLNRTRAARLDGLDDGIPIFPANPPCRSPWERR